MRQKNKNYEKKKIFNNKTPQYLTLINLNNCGHGDKHGAILYFYFKYLSREAYLLLLLLSFLKFDFT